MMRPSILSLVLTLAACGSGSLPVGAPATHRAVATSCGASGSGAIACMSPAGTTGDCSVSSDCTAGTNGRCLTGRGPCLCSYDACSSDTTCGPGKLCECGGGTGNNAASNRCVVADCYTDSDCGTGQFCAPALDELCGNYIGVTAYRCTTPKDRCRVDADCQGDGGSFAYCNYSSELGHWACTTTLCAG